MWLAWLAQQSTGSEPVEWLQYGALGLVIVALLLGWLWPKPAVDRMLREIDRHHDEQGKQIEALIAEVHALRAELRDRRREPPAT